MTGAKLFCFLVAGALAGGAVVGDTAYGQSRKDSAVREVWTVALPESLRSRIHQAAVSSTSKTGR